MKLKFVENSCLNFVGKKAEFYLFGYKVLISLVKYHENNNGGYYIYVSYKGECITEFDSKIYETVKSENTLINKAMTKIKSAIAKDLAKKEKDLQNAKAAFQKLQGE